MGDTQAVFGILGAGPARASRPTAWRGGIAARARVVTTAAPLDALLGEVDNVLTALLPLLDARPLVIHLAGATAGAGVTTIARALAASAGAHPWCRVLLLDASAVGRTVDAVPGATPSLLDGGSPIETAICGRPVGIARLGAGGATAPRPGVLRDAFDALRASWRLVLVDGPPLLSSVSAVSLASAADATLLIARAERDASRDLRDARDRLGASGGRLLGTVLNNRRANLPKAIDRMLGRFGAGEGGRRRPGPAGA